MRNCDISSYQILQYYVGEGSQSQIFIFVFGEIDLRVAENQEYRGGTPTEFAIGESPIAETRRYFGWTWGIVRGFRDAAFFWGVLAPNYYWPMGALEIPTNLRPHRNDKTLYAFHGPPINKFDLEKRLFSSVESSRGMCA